MFSEDIYKTKMSKALEVFNKELSSLRTGRANANMLDLIKHINCNDKQNSKMLRDSTWALITINVFFCIQFMNTMGLLKDLFIHGYTIFLLS